MEALELFINSMWWKVISSLIATASMIAMATPNKVDNAVLQALRDFMNYLALNFGNAEPKKK